MNVSIKMGLIVKRESVNVKFIWNNPVVKGMSILVQNYKENHFQTYPIRLFSIICWIFPETYTSFIVC